jgi:hypothetical protein
MKRARDSMSTGSKLVVRTAYDPSPKTRVASPMGASELGSAMGNIKGGRPSAAEPLYPGGKAFQPVPLGNTLTTQGIGVGGGRTVQPAGGQGTWGPTVGERPGPARGLDSRGRLPPGKP